MIFNRVAIVGLGLIGGSLARVIKKRKIAKEVIGVFRRKKSFDKSLKLRLVDSGYINPSDKTAAVSFHTVRPQDLVDLLSGESRKIEDRSSIAIEVPCGAFRFIDIELAKPFFSQSVDRTLNLEN